MIFQSYDRIVFAGDSVTDMGSAQPVGEGLFDNLGHSYVRHIENMLSAIYPERMIRVTNSGISGNTSRDLLARFDRDVIDLHPQWISICIGINDVWRQFDMPAMPEAACTPEEYRENLIAMLEKAKQVNGLKGIFLLTPYYIEPSTSDPMRAKMDEYGRVCRDLADKYACTLVDFQKMYDEYCVHRHSAYIAWDRVHPNQIGAYRMACTFLAHCGFDPLHKPE